MPPVDHKNLYYTHAAESSKLLTQHRNVEPGSIVALVRYPVREDDLTFVPAVVTFSYGRQVQRCLSVNKIVAQQRHPTDVGFVGVEYAIV